MTTNKEKIKVACETILSFGGTELPDYLPGLAFGAKAYQTAVGPREAHFYLTASDGINQSLTGSFYSEGRNVIESCPLLVPVDATEEQVEGLCTQFLTGCERMINQSYARKLYLDREAKEAVRQAVTGS